MQRLRARHSGADVSTMYKRQLVFYDDAATFGGHELMTLRLVEFLAARQACGITFIASRLNTELCRRLGDIVPKIKFLPTPYTSGRGQWLRTYLSVKSLLQLLRLLRSRKPDLLIVVQGGIALSSLGIVAGRMAGVRTLSYLPMTHDESLFAPTPLRARLRQWLVQPFYNIPDCLVTAHAWRVTRGAGGAARSVPSKTASRFHTSRQSVEAPCGLPWVYRMAIDWC